MGRLCSSRYEREARKLGFACIAGLDEVGRGALFGPVTAAAVVLDPARRIHGLDDSKKLRPERREQLAARIREHALAWAVAEVDAGRIDAWNIHQASCQAMLQALSELELVPDYLLIDAVTLQTSIPQKSLIRGDARSISIAAASILAKQARDAVMDKWATAYPQYRFERNRGYATADHLEALRRFGPTPHHRFSYAPVRQAGCWAASATQAVLPLPGPPEGNGAE
ncbi:MAG TPA: ribonuclease HII [Candidatus Acidoferrales bacterium]|nr:ribonuclease HII [Candidatus Acidoferrales bacterium]